MTDHDRFLRALSLSMDLPSRRDPVWPVLVGLVALAVLWWGR